MTPKSGDLLWQFQTGSNAGGAVATYEVNGEQYVAIPSHDALWAFKIGGTVQPLPAPTPPKTETTMGGRVMATDPGDFRRRGQRHRPGIRPQGVRRACCPAVAHKAARPAAR